MDNKRVGFAESIYSELTPKQSTEHNAQILLNMSSYQELEYFFESSGLNNGPEIVMAVLAFISVTMAVLLAEYLMRAKTDDDQKAARKALAQVLNDDGNEDKDKDLMEYAQED